MRRIVLLLAFAGIASAQCGKLAFNPITGRLDCIGSASGGTAWSAITNPTQALSLTMGAFATTFTYNGTTGTIDGIKATDTAANTGTGILIHASTAAGSTMTPFQGDVNGVGYRITSTGTFIGVGQTATTNVQFSGVSSGTCNLTTTATGGALVPGASAECALGGAVLPWAGVYSQFLFGVSTAPAVNAGSCTGATIGTGSTNIAGKITGLPTGSCSVVVTMANSATATTGWSCAVSDQTTGNLFRQTASTTTTVTFAGTSVSGDVLAYGPCAAF